MSGGGTNSVTTPAELGIKVQTSVYGTVIPVVYGKTTVAGNLIWYGWFTSHPHTEGGGGKGGGSGGTVTYTYSAACIVSVGDGQLTIGSIWKGKDYYQTGWVNPPQTTKQTTFSPNVSNQYTLPGDWLKTESIYADEVPFREGVDYTRSGSVLTFAPGLQSVVFSLNYWYQPAAVWQSALSLLGLSQSSGNIGQALWGWLATNEPDQALAYSGLTYVYAPDYNLGDNASLDNHKFEVSSPSPSVSSGDVSPAVIAVDALTNARNGADFPVANIGSTTAWHSYCMAQDLLVSLAMTEQRAASDWLQDLLSVSNSDVVVSQGVLQFVPLGDTALTANGVTYTPNTTPLFDLTEDHFLQSGSADLVGLERVAQDDTYNCIKVEYTDRAGQYVLQVAEARDTADIELRGLRVKSTVQAHALHTAARASTAAALLLQKEQGVRCTYKFNLPFYFEWLDPLDIVTISYGLLGLLRVPVRISIIKEQSDGSFDIEAEDCPLGMAAPPLYGAQAGSGFAHNYNADPGSVTDPVFFEPPVELTTTGLEVWAAVSGQNSTWGGCNVWASTDGVTFKQIGVIEGGSRYGTITAAMGSAGTSAAVQLAGLGGVLTAGSLQDAQLHNTLCWVGAYGVGEFLDYQGATLTGANAYTLGGLLRGAYSSAATAHAAGASFVRVDDRLAKSDPLDFDLIGQPIYFKFQSFNVYGGGLQDLAAVARYTYLVTGSMAQLPPPCVDDFTVRESASGARVFEWAWLGVAKPVDLAGYRIRYRQGSGWTWDNMLPLDTDDGFFTASPHETTLLLAGPYTFSIKTVDKLGNESASALYISATLTDPRLGDALCLFDLQAQAWPGALTNLNRDGPESYYLVIADTAIWDTLPSTWDAWTRWAMNPASTTASYTTTAQDIGLVCKFRPVAAVDTDAAYTVFESHSSDGSTWSAWALAGAEVQARYVRLRVDFEATLVVVKGLVLRIIANTQSEVVQDLVVGSGMGANYLGTGDIRVPITRSYSAIREVTVSFQNIGGNWGWELMDKATTGPRIRFYNASNVLANPAKVDINVKGLST